MKKSLITLLLILSNIALMAQLVNTQDGLQVPSLKNAEFIGFDEDGKAVAKEFPTIIKTINGKKPDKKGNIQINSGGSSDELVPYSGAHKNVELGNNSITLNDGSGNSSEISPKVFHVDGEWGTYSKITSDKIHIGRKDDYWLTEIKNQKIRIKYSDQELLMTPWNIVFRGGYGNKLSLLVKYDKGEKNTSHVIHIPFRTGTLARLEDFKNLKNIRLRPYSPPVNPQRGTIYFDNATNKLRCYDGSTWHDLY